MTATDQIHGSKCRSSQTFIIATAIISLFSGPAPSPSLSGYVNRKECFLLGFTVPILPYMLETRLHIHPSATQTLTTTLLTLYGFISLLAAPVIAHFADKTPSRKIPLLLSLVVCVLETVLVAWSTTGAR